MGIAGPVAVSGRDSLGREAQAPAIRTIAMRGEIVRIKVSLSAERGPGVIDSMPNDRWAERGVESIIQPALRPRLAARRPKQEYIPPRSASIGRRIDRHRLQETMQLYDGLKGAG